MMATLAFNGLNKYCIDENWIKEENTPFDKKEYPIR